MAPRSAGDVVVRFSVQDAEVVRKALEALGRDGDKAMRQLDAASQQPSRGLGALSKIMEEVKGRVTGLAFSIGPVGTALVSLGPVGIAAAATIGAVTAAFTLASDKATEFAEKARQIKEAAETAGLSVTQFALLRSAGAKVGLDAEQTSKFIDNLTIKVEELRHGGGALFEVLARIDTALVREVATTRDTAEAVDVLARAYQRLEDQGQRNTLAKAIGGRGGVQGGQLLAFVAEQGGLKAVEQGARDAGKAIDEDLLKRVAQLKIEIDAVNRRASNIWGAAFSEETLRQQKRSAEFWLSIAESFERIMKAKSNAPPGGVAGPDDFMLPPGMVAPGVPTSSSSVPSVPLLKGGDRAGAVAKITAPPSVSPEVSLALYQRMVSVLGEAITPTEQLKLKQLELSAAMEKGGVSADARNRALAAFVLGQERAAVATRTQLGVVSEEALLTQRLTDLKDLQAKGYIKNAEEMAAAERLVRKEVKETMDAQAVRRSDFPALARLAIDAADLRKNLDDGLSGALRSTTATMIEMAKGTKTLGQGFSELSVRILESVANAMLMKSVVGPVSGFLSSGLGGLFGGGTPAGVDASGTIIPSAMGNAFVNGRVTPFRLGGVITRPILFPMANGMGLAGEAGEEAVMPLRRLNNGRLGVSSAGGGTQINVTHQVINNHPAAQVSTRDEDDGRGGRRTVTVIEEMMASGFARQGSRAKRALFQSGAMERL